MVNSIRFSSLNHYNRMPDLQITLPLMQGKQIAFPEIFPSAEIRHVTDPDWH